MASYSRTQSHSRPATANCCDGLRSNGDIFGVTSCSLSGATLIISVLALLIIVLLASALIVRSAALGVRARTALPAGKILYSDTIREERSSETLISWQHGLKGRPDYLVETTEGIVPIEIKSTFLPRSGRPYDSHVMQLACYCLLCEEAMNARVPFGLIRYRNGEVRVEYTPKLRARLLSLLAEMRKVQSLRIVHRNHSQPRRCAGCGFKDLCGEPL